MSAPGSAEYAQVADDLFAGAGGWDLAAGQLGIHARGVENMPEARATRDAAGLTTIHDDVWTYEPDGTASGLIASPPCQTFSAAGKGAGRAALKEIYRAIASGAYRSLTRLRGLGMYVGDTRTALVLTPLHFATTGGYEWLTWEQVPTVLPVWQACAAELEELGWHTWTGYLHAEQYGVPQTRKRAFLLASRTGPVAPPEPTHSRYYSRDPGRSDLGVHHWVSMAEALGWGLSERPAPTITEGGTETGGAEPIAKLARYTGREDWVLRTGLNSAIVGPGPKRDQLMAEGRWRECHKPQERPLSAPAPTITGQSSGWRVMAGSGTSCAIVDPRPVTEPAQTITGAANAEWGMRETRAPGPGQRDPEGVRLTPAECGILQSFPADHPWQGNLGKQHLQAGNAIPPGLAGPALSVAASKRQEAVA